MFNVAVPLTQCTHDDMLLDFLWLEIVKTKEWVLPFRFSDQNFVCIKMQQGSIITKKLFFMNIMNCCNRHFLKNALKLKMWLHLQM